MTASLITSGPFAFADGNGGHICNFGSAPGIGEADTLLVASDTVVSTPVADGFSLTESRVVNMGAYIFHRIAVGGEGSTVTLTTAGNLNTAVVWIRWGNLVALDKTADAGVDGAVGAVTPTATTAALAEAGELSIVLGALHSIGTANQTAPVWTTGLTPLTTLVQGSGAQGVRAFVAYKVNAGTAAEAAEVSWTGDGCQDRYTLIATFTASTPASGAGHSHGHTKNRSAIPMMTLGGL